MEGAEEGDEAKEGTEHQALQSQGVPNGGQSKMAKRRVRVREH